MLLAGSYHRCCRLAAALPSRCSLARLPPRAGARGASQSLPRRAVAEQGADAAAPPALQLPPRQQGVSEGAWDRADAAAVRAALGDAEQPAAGPSGRSAEGGGAQRAAFAPRRSGSASDAHAARAGRRRGRAARLQRGGAVGAGGGAGPAGVPRPPALGVPAAGRAQHGRPAHGAGPARRERAAGPAQRGAAPGARSCATECLLRAARAAGAQGAARGAGGARLAHGPRGGARARGRGGRHAQAAAAAGRRAAGGGGGHPRARRRAGRRRRQAAPHRLRVLPGARAAAPAPRALGAAGGPAMRCP